MNILDRIIEHKHKEVAERKKLCPVKLLEQSISFSSPTVSLKKYVQRKDKSGIIAEIKRKSPSKAIINASVSIQRTSVGYMEAGASALSILTDKEFFGGTSDDLIVARKFNFCPILRKDFVVDEYQIVEAKSIGADAILLIAAALPAKRLNELALFAKSLGLEILMEVHTDEELIANQEAEVDLIGVNNRDLKSFTVSLDVSKELAPLMPKGKVLVSESGIDSPTAILELRKYGYEGFLLGETFMKHSRPEQAAMDFIKELSQLTK
ncbi:MAG: indole-3-glycerol phosphate synthase TrpC [Cyclobacteriaceae bacterium]|nr:indole-3-glycerol phosphate synthase TrpC [Cyclobacteriaceae bacterium]